MNGNSIDEARRRLLRLGVLTAASAVLPLEAFGLPAGKVAVKSVTHAAFAPTQNEYDVLSTLTPEDFKPFVGAVFQAQSQAGSTRLKLTTVQDPPALPGTLKTAPPFYALRFKVVSGNPVKQDTYVFVKSGLPAFAMFVVPSAPGTKPFCTGLVNRSAQ